ncbi:nucleobindin-2 isoform X1 [Brachionus plicatilis]|uniref:Nucleobindin-2 isoform X1 n=1 Tax=Brachionus plicatilis TaxID=10195 RepID=A0A3M7QMK8_BRAPC|nr:nucleobindin-2 isoform X1 [Brachionus plicatilis]
MLKFVVLCSIIGLVVCPPVLPDNNHQPVHKSVNETLEKDPLLSLEYHKYLKEIVNILETDPEFKKQIENASIEDIKSGRIAEHLALVDPSIRTKLDEIKRMEIERLRRAIQRKAALSNLKAHEIQTLLPKHVDHGNIDTFEVHDLERLIKQATFDLEEVDKLRREEFKDHEIEKEYERRKKMQQADAETRQKLEEQHKRSLEMRKNHQRVNHPGSKDQLEEVWEEEDKLDGEDFEPVTFFKLHDIDGNNYWDEFEVEALFNIELDKIYNKTDPEFDPAERFEEMNRMREHVFGEIDKNKDRLVSLDEFVESTKSREFKQNEEWKGVDDEAQFSEDQIREYSQAHVEEERLMSTPVNDLRREQAHRQEDTQHHQPPRQHHQQPPEIQQHQPPQQHHQNVQHP